MMAGYLAQATVSLATRQDLIKAFPCFEALTLSQSKEMAALMAEVRFTPQEKIVTENELVDSIYIIVNGEAEVMREVKQRKKAAQVPLAALRAGEGIGLNDTGFYSSTGKRTASVIAVTDMLLLRLELEELYQFLKKNDLEPAMYAASLQMMRMQFIKQSLPFAKLSPARLQWLADRVEELSVPAGTSIFTQGDEGDKCYLIRAGKVDIVMKNEKGEERRLALLKPPVLFGEATLITHTPRNATARAVNDSDLLVLRHEHLSELIESENNVANMFMTLMVDRSRPIKNPHVTVHHRTTVDGQEITILKNPDNGSYFKLSQEGSFIWEQLNGKQTMQDMTLDLAEQYKVFAPDVVAALIYKLTQSGFISNLEIDDNVQLGSSPLWVRAVIRVRRLLESRFAFGDADQWITKTYQKYVCYLFTKIGQFILAILAIAGFVAFVDNTGNVLLFFSYQHASWLLLLGLIPLSLVEVLLHELGHAYAVKAFGREVHYIGVGWYWFAPIAFTDTSDMWLATRKPRMLVNLAGVYVDMLAAGLAALFILLIPNPYLQGMLWLFALYTYIGGFRMLSPLQEMDGYYVLMDWVEKPRLRQAAVIWLVKKFPKALRQPHLFREHRPEVIYWIACILFLILVSILTLTVQTFVFAVLGIQSSDPYLSLILPLLVVVFSSLSIIADIRNQAEE
jgi:putative peptide zinc metalloprotease protein